MSIQNLGRIALPTQDGLLFVRTEEIVRCEADGAYTTVYLLNRKRILISKNLKEIEQLLPNTVFFRAHNSHLVNLSHLLRYVRSDGGLLELIDGSTVYLARRKKELFLRSTLGN